MERFFFRMERFFLKKQSVFLNILCPPQRFDPLPTQRVSFCTILRYQFLVTDPLNFLKAPPAPIYTNFKREARAEKTRSFGKQFEKIPKTAFWSKFVQNRVVLKLWESSENQFGRPVKRSTKFAKFFLKIRSPFLENPRSALVRMI